MAPHVPRFPRAATESTSYPGPTMLGNMVGELRSDLVLLSLLLLLLLTAGSQISLLKVLCLSYRGSPGRGSGTD